MFCTSGRSVWSGFIIPHTVITKLPASCGYLADLVDNLLQKLSTTRYLIPCTMQPNVYNK